MSSCACRRWGPGTTCEKPVDTANSRELETKMKTMMAEREKQANFWVNGESCVATENNKVCRESTTTTLIVSQKPSMSEIKTIDVNTQQRQEDVVNASQQMRFWN